MPLIRITESEQKEFDKIPVGFYEVYIDAVDKAEPYGELEKSTIRLKIRDDVEAQSEWKNRVLFVNINTNPNIAWKLSNIATAAGVSAGTDFDGLDAYTGAIKGASMKIKLAYRTWDDKEYPDVKSFYPTSLTPYEVDMEDELDLI